MANAHPTDPHHIPPGAAAAASSGDPKGACMQAGGTAMTAELAAAIDAKGLDWMKVWDAFKKYGPAVFDILKDLFG